VRPCPALLIVLTLASQGCGGAASSPRPDDVSAPDGDGGRLDRGAEAGSPAQPALDAAPTPSRDGSTDDPLDGGTPPEAGSPRAAAPCGTDLDFVGGEARPSFGALAGFDAGALDLERPGAFPVIEQKVGIPTTAETRAAAGYTIAVDAGQLAGTVYAPAEGSTRASGRFPLMLAGAGFGAGYGDYAELHRHFASYGVVVLGLTTRGSSSTPLHDQEALETSQAITWMLEKSPFAASLDADKVALTGHSKGGKVAFFTAAIDPRVDVVFGWDPSNAGGPPCGAIADLAGVACNALPVAPSCLAQGDGTRQPEGVLHYSQAESFVFGVPPDSATNPTPEHNSLQFYRGALSPANLVYLSGSHASWLTNGGGALFGNTDVVRVTKAVQTAKLLTVFYGASGLDRYLPPNGAYFAAQGALIKQLATK
jgi:Chlorophyllase